MTSLLDASKRAFEAGAWEGGKAKERFAMLVDLRRQAQSAAQQSEDEFRDAIARQPREVPASSWQARWSSPQGGGMTWAL